MIKKADFHSRVTFILKNLLLTYFLTILLLLLLSFLLYRFALSEKIIALGITGIYVISTFLSGLLAGKHEQTKRFLWGLLMGFLYFILLSAISLLANSSAFQIGSGFITTMILCCGGGMLGGMLS